MRFLIFVVISTGATAERRNLKVHLKINSPLVSLLDLSTRDFNRLVEMTGVGYRALSGAMRTTVTTTTSKVVFQVITLREKSLGLDDREKIEWIFYGLIKKIKKL